ncbi:hypothetical protein MASR2M47_45940 [Draconibacterium sp.]
MSKSYNLQGKIVYFKIENAYAVWFKETHKFLMIEEPAFYILKLILKNVTTEEIAQNFSVRYKNPISEVRKFIAEIEQKLHQYLNSDRKGQSTEKASTTNILPIQALYAEKTYSIKNQVLSIYFGDKELKEVIHPLISHHEIEKQTNPNHLFQIYRVADELFLSVDSDFIETFESAETGYLKAAVLMQLLGILYEVEHKDWMMTIHASAVTDGDSAIVFPATAGSGKSTLAALLQAHGFKMLSDDFLAMDLINKKIFHLPVAATIKNGSLNVLTPYFPELKDISEERAFTGKQVRYLAINNSFGAKEGFEARNFVFVNYSHDKTFKFEEVTKKLAIQRLLEETWINPKPSAVSGFFKWFDKTRFYELRYSETTDAVAVVTQLFKQ